MVNKVSFGDIVLLNFPFTDDQTFKRRPALVITDCNDGDIIVCRITSKIYDSDKDIFIDNWEKCRLKLPSVIRVHKIATLEKGMVESIIGKIDELLKEKVKNIFATLTK